MGIFDKNKTEFSAVKRKVVGAYLPLSLIETVSLHSMLNAHSISNFIEELVKEHCKANEINRVDLIKEVAEKAYEYWQQQAEVMSFDDLLSNVHSERHLTQKTKDEIIKLLKNEKETQASRSNKKK